MFGVVLNFNGNCVEAIEFYKDIFQVKEGIKIIKYKDLPDSDSQYIEPSLAEKVMHSEMEIIGIKFLLFDSQEDYVLGNNIGVSFSFSLEEEIKDVYNKLKEGGKIFKKLNSTPFAKLYCDVQDKFGIRWQLIVLNK